MLQFVASHRAVYFRQRNPKSWGWPLLHICGLLLALGSLVNGETIDSTVSSAAVEQAGASARRLLAKQKHKHSPPPKSLCPHIRTYTAYPNAELPGGNSRSLGAGKKLDDIAKKCTADCTCKAFSSDGWLKSITPSATNATKAKAGACLYVRNTPGKCKPPPSTKGTKSSPPPVNRSSRPSPPMQTRPCTACVVASYRLKWVLRSGKNGTNDPLTPKQCDAVAAMLNKGSLGTVPGLDPFSCSGDPKTDTSSYYEESVARVCANGGPQDTQAWLDNASQEVAAWAQGMVADALDVNFCWVRVEATNSCGQGDNGSAGYPWSVCD